jgi:hypothetical protein
MSAEKNKVSIPDGYVRLAGSERRASSKAKLAGHVDLNEKFKVTISLRRRKDGAPLPDFDYFMKTPPKLRKRFAPEEFAEKFGAHPDDIKAVVGFAEKHGLKVVKTHAGRRTVEVEGTASQFSKAFGVAFARYEVQARPTRDKKLPARISAYRGREGFIHVPKELSEIILGVFGLDNRPVSHRANNPGDPDMTSTITVQQATSLYNFPLPGAAISGQTIGIIAPHNGFGGFLQSDLNQTYSSIGLTAPSVIPIPVDSVPNGTSVATTTAAAAIGDSVLQFAAVPSTLLVNSFGQYTAASTTYYFMVTAVSATTVTCEAVDPSTNQLVTTGFFTAVPLGTVIYFNLDGETNQDIAISTLAAQGANVAVYSTYDSQGGWVDMILRAIQPEPGDFPAGVNPPSVLSASWILVPGDDPDGLVAWGSGVTTSTLLAISAAFQDAALLNNGPTICIASGDFGSNCNVGRSGNYTSATTELYTSAAAAVGDDVLTFASTAGVSVGSIGCYSDPVTGVWYYVKATAVTPTTVTVQALDNATQSWVGTGFFDAVPNGTMVTFNLEMEGDGYAHVMYPASDPWVLSVGGTTLGQYYPSGSSTPSWVEYAWNDAFAYPTYTWGTGGGGVSGFFPLPSYQNGAGVPASINPTLPTNPDLVTVTPSAAFNATGRGVPDVAANASIYSGYSGFYLGGVLSGDPGNGTSASAPFWAGLIAVLNSNAGFNIGFANPTLYALGAGSGAFNPLNPLWRDPAYPQLANCPLDNSNFGIAGYPTGPGWDACTGLGSPNGMALLTAFTDLASVYILGGYQSPDIILTDLSTSLPIPIGGLPGGPWDTQLAPNTDYGFSANIHNDSSATVDGVQVKFWAIPGGVGTSGTMVGTMQTVSIPAHSTVTVQASAPFHSAPAGDHLCAVVSLYSPATGGGVDAATALDIPNPGYSDTHEYSAWRNTDSMLAMMHSHFGFHLGLGHIPFHLEEPVHLQINAKHVPALWKLTPAAQKIADTLRAVGAKSNVPLYLLPGVRQGFLTVPVKAAVQARKGLEVKEREPGIWLLKPEPNAETIKLEITGQVPSNAKPGDVLLVNVTAAYPRIKGRGARTVEFLEFVHVIEKKRQK